MSASARARASQKYKSRLSLEIGGYGPHTGTPMSGAERARRFRERRKADAATANIPLGGNIKCRRNQFPVVSASAITIYKSQGGTFDEVVFNYDKSQQIQLVYVALSRVTSIDGLYLTNDKDDFKFYHGQGSTAPTMKDIRDEYDRMANHLLPTLSMQARAFCKRDVLAERNEDQGGYLHRRRQLILIVSAFNAQSLVAHAGDIESGNILMNSDYKVISQTWMNCANTDDQWLRTKSK
ncbi:uncharacterized protein TNCV_4886041 [Trichonephila clavipes]|uniref:Uncharacterized protein n=1 Tax=Trichonephila clavipes TaxID=2585209 RepID=A0A8X6RIM1_TRICX|nr:uncharacterized protein TNCV_4886041 [Trichonephila clavipes]